VKQTDAKDESEGAQISLTAEAKENVWDTRASSLDGHLWHEAGLCTL